MTDSVSHKLACLRIESRAQTASGCTTRKDPRCRSPRLLAERSRRHDGLDCASRECQPWARLPLLSGQRSYFSDAGRRSYAGEFPRSAALRRYAWNSRRPAHPVNFVANRKPPDPAGNFLAPRSRSEFCRYSQKAQGQIRRQKEAFLGMLKGLIVRSASQRENLFGGTRQGR